jgi:hypothetical protein
MENGKQPINPQMYTKNGDGENDFIPLNDGEEPFVFAKKMGGLTKREYFAAMAMQGLLASTSGQVNEQWTAESSVILADELLKQLENN